LASLQQPASPTPESLGGGGGEVSDWSQHWGSSAGEDWGRQGGSEQTWPDLGPGPYKGRYKDEDKSKSKSCSSSDCDSSSLAGDSRSPGDQVVPISEGGPGLADAAWEGETGNTQSTPSAVSEQSNVSVEQEVETRQGWLDSDLKNSNNFLDDDDVDDLGFDPFHETQKGLADLLESEAAEAQQQAKVSSPSPDWRTQLPTPPAGRAKLPPPGFHPSSSQHNLPPSNLGNFSHGGFGGPGGLSLPPSSVSAVDSLFGLPRGRTGPAPGFGGQAQPTSPDFLFGLGGQQGGSKSGSGLGLGGLGLGERLYDQKPSHGAPHLQENFSSKDWQDGLRALLPSNVNVSFGQGGGGGAGPANTGPAGLGHFGLQNNFQPSYSQPQTPGGQQGLQHNSNWGSGLSNGLGNDWTMLDPAIVSGQLAPHETPQHPHHARPESPQAHNWLAANLEQLHDSAGQYSSQNNLIPGFNALGLGERLGAGARGRVGGGWGGPSTATPPPGFSHHRQNLGGHYQGFGNKNSEAHKIGEF